MTTPTPPDTELTAAQEIALSACMDSLRCFIASLFDEEGDLYLRITLTPDKSTMERFLPDEEGNS